MTWASPSARPAYFAGASRASMQVRIAKCRAGGNASLLLSPKSPAYFSFAETTSLNIVLRVVMVDILRLQTHDQGEMRSARSWLVRIIELIFVVLRQRETNFAGNRHASGQNIPVAEAGRQPSINSRGVDCD